MAFFQILSNFHQVSRFPVVQNSRFPMGVLKADFSLENGERLPLISHRTKLGHPIHILPGRPVVPQAAALILLLKNGFAKND